MPTSPPVLAAGTVLWRIDDGVLNIGIVHRPRYDDWTLPKGKLDEGEHLLACAVRETEEETGHRITLGRPAGTQRYTTGGRRKIVHYWVAAADPHARVPHNPDEVSEVRFLPAARAAELLTYQRDTRLIDDVVPLALDTTPVVLLRHAKALSRSSWSKGDAKRPLAARGEQEAAHLVQALSALGIERIVSSDAVRCRDTVQPYAEAAGLAIEAAPALSEEGFRADPEAAASVLEKLLVEARRTVVCSHRPVLPSLRSAAEDSATFALPAWKPAPGSSLVLHHRGGRIISAEPHLA